MALTVTVCLGWPSVARPCAGAPPEGESILVKHESALIVWDEGSHVEHFVRTAAFGGSARSFGFLVPSPARPTLAEADEEVLLDLYRVTSPESVVVKDVEVDPTLSFFSFYFGVPDLPLTRSGVDVVEETHVAGLDATILAANDASALSDWLRGRGFEQREALKRWLAIYVAKGWYVTAFRYERPGERILDANGEAKTYDMEDDTGNLKSVFASRAVRITFPTNEPVYPYLEPDDVPDVPHRILDLFVIANQRMDGVLIDSGARPWNADVVYADEMWRGDASSGYDSMGSLGYREKIGVGLPSHPRITRYVDHATKRAASDLVFRPSSAGSVRPPATVVHLPVRWPVPYELIPVPVAGIWWWRRRARKRRARLESEMVH